MQPLIAVTMDNKVVWHNAAKPQLNNVDTDVTLQPSLLPVCQSALLVNKQIKQ